MWFKRFDRLCSLRARAQITPLFAVNPGAVATPWWSEPERGGKPVPATEERLATMCGNFDIVLETIHASLGFFLLLGLELFGVC